MNERRTIRSSVSLEGLGLHSGAPTRLTIHPDDKGIRFRYRTSTIGAIPENVTETTRCTKLGEISTIEHLMSAFAGLEITDAEVELTAPELPGLDGSAKPYVSALLEAGIETIGESEMPELFTRIFLQEDSIKIAVSKGNGHWSYAYSTGERWPHEMQFETESVVGSYQKEIAPARTFALSEEVPHILAAGLGKGLTEQDVLILGTNRYENEPRFPDEPARHKLLDIVGDLYLSGVPISHLNVSAARSGHRTNVSAARQLRQAVFGSS